MVSLGCSLILNLSASSTVSIVIYASGSTKTVDVFGDGSSNRFNSFSAQEIS